MNRETILNTAKQYVNVDRADVHGSAEKNFDQVAAYWAAHLDTPITATAMPMN